MSLTDVNGTAIEDLRTIDDDPYQHVGCANHGPTVLKGTCKFAGARCHVFFIAVVEDDEGNAGIQRAICDPCDRYDDMLHLDSEIAGFQTVEIAGYPGEWVMFLHPYAR